MVMAHLRGQKKNLEKKSKSLVCSFCSQKTSDKHEKTIIEFPTLAVSKAPWCFFFFRCPEAFFIYVCFIPLGVLYPEDLQLAFSTTVCHRCLLLSIYQAVPSLGCKAPNVV